jgi:outer membrane protein TolC
MKVLTLSIALSLLYSTQLLADTNTTSSSLEAYISSNKQQSFMLERDKAESSSNILRDTWIAPIMLNYSYGVSEAYDNKSTTQKASISIDQPIFQSGGIYFGIKYAQATREYANYSVDVAERKMIKDAVALLMQIKQSTLRIKKQELLIANAEINLEVKTQQYLSGQLDSSFLDDAIVQKNTAKQTLFDLEATKQRVVSQFRVISDLAYESATIPHLELIDEDAFLTQNISYELSKSESEKNRYYKNMTIAKYLPKVSVYGGYNWDRSENLNFGGVSVGGTQVRETDYYTYGLKASMPININTFDDMQTTRVDYLKAKIAESDKQRELKALYEQVMQNIASFDKKIALSQENQEIYAKILADTKELLHVGYKTSYDVDLLQNSYDIQSIDVAIFELERQLELLNLYEMYVKSE